MKKISQKNKPVKIKGISPKTGLPVKVRYQFKFDKELLDALKIEAAKDKRAFNQYVEIALERHLAAVTAGEKPGKK